MLKLTRNLCLLAALIAAGASQAATPRQLSDFYLAAQMDTPGAVRDLLGVIGNPNGRDPVSGETALILALREDSMKVVPVLLANPAIDLEATAINGNTALMMAAFKRNAPAVQMLLDKGARVNRSGWNALHYAAAGGAADIVRILLEHKAEINALAPNNLTALMLAAREGQENAAKALLAAGADTTLRNSEGLDAVQIAEHADKPNIVAMIRQQRAARSQ